MPDYHNETLPLIEPSEDEQTFHVSKFRLALLFSTLYFGVLLAAVDSTIVSTLLGHIGSDLNAMDNISWIAAGYTIAYSAFQPLYGKFSDIWGRKRVSVVCTVIFGLGCYMCGASKALPMLVAGRFVSGIGAGGMLSMSTVTISDYVSLRSRGIFQGIGNICFGIGASLGSIFGGWFTALGGWRLAFLAQVPLIMLSVLLQILLLNGKPTNCISRQNAWQRIDWWGSITLVSSLIAFMVAVSTGGTKFAWLSWPIALTVLFSALSFAVFWRVEKSAIEPVMPQDIILSKTVLNACITNFIASGSVFAFIYFCPILLQAVFHYSYITVGHRIVVNFLGVIIGSLGTGIIMKKTGRYHSLGVLCCIVLAIGFLVVLAFPYIGSLASSATYQSLAFLLSGIGYAGMLTVTLLALIAAVEPHHQATTTAAQYTFRGAGSSLGIAVAAAVFSNVLKRALDTNVGNDSKEKRIINEAVFKSLEAIWDQPQKYIPAIVLSYRQAGLAVIMFCFLGTVLATFTCYLMEEHELDKPQPQIDETTLVRPSTPPGPMVSTP